jgi:Tfp pilus assembly protein PilF
MSRSLPSLLRTLLLVALLPWGAVHAQQLTYTEWQERAAKDIRLLPHYGDAEKTVEQRIADTVFVERVMEQEPDRRKASDRLAGMGLALLAQGDMVNAMFRFNHAYLVSPGNPAVYNGYGAFFMAMDRPTEAGVQYLQGLERDSMNVDLLNGLATAFIAEQYQQRPTDTAKADRSVGAALLLLERALAADPKHADSAYKRSVCHLLRNECPEARIWYARFLELGGGPRAEGYGRQLDAACPKGSGR